MNISAKDVQELRRRTGAGMMDCKKALTEAAGDFDKAVALLKEWGIAKASKKSGREASEGILVAVLSSDKKKGALIEVNCETDFVAKTPEYNEFAKATAEHIFNKGFKTPEEFDEATQNKIKEGIAKFGENVIVNSIKRIESKSILGSYIHTNKKTGTIISLDVEGSLAQKISDLALDLAVHTTANQVVALSKEFIDPKVLENKKAEYAEEVKKSGKPENMIAKIVEGKLNKFYKDETLLSQPFLKNEEISVEQHINNVAKETGTKIKATAFIKTAIGE